MLHIHFGAGRLGLGLVGPSFRTESSEFHILNRAVSTAKATGETALTALRRNELLRTSPDRTYYLHRPGGRSDELRPVAYDGFHTYGEEPGPAVADVLAGSRRKESGIVVTASVLQPAHYGPVIATLNELCARKAAGEPIGPVFLVACENTLSSDEVMSDPDLAPLILDHTRRQVVPVRALVDRLCTGMEEIQTGSGPAVCVCAENYGSLKLELTPATEALVELCRGSQVEFSCHVEVEKQIKSWLLNGTHWLIALTAFQSSNGCQELKLNEYLCAADENRSFALQVMQEMKEGVAILLRIDPRYAAFAAAHDVEAYLDGAAQSILKRFFDTEDPINRILARFRAPSSEAFTTIEAFSKRFADRVGEPIRAYEHEKGVAPPGASHSLFSMLQLVASGTFVDDHPAH